MAGAAALLIVGFFANASIALLWRLSIALLVGLALQAVTLAAELFGSHANLDSARAADMITDGAGRAQFWIVTVLLGTLLPAILVWLSPPLAVLGAALALLGLWIYEELWVRAGQSLPLS
jgi:hypothetical protein